MRAALSVFAVVLGNSRSLFAPAYAPVYAPVMNAAPATYPSVASPYVNPVQYARKTEAPRAPVAALLMGVGAGVLATFAVSGRRAREPQMVDLPRIALPSGVADALKDSELRNPNDMTQEEYNSYSGAAILGTLVIFLIPGALIFDISGFFFDFIFSALLGGGAMIFLVLNPSTSEFAGKAGDSLLGVLDKIGEKLK
jgi:hypothetical protein